MKATLADELLNLPNMLTLGRIAAIPIVMLFIWRGEPEACVIAGWIYAAASLTDFFDGWLARRRGLVTVMGKFLDPLADKLIVMAMLIMLVALHRISAWIVVIILAREMTINGLRSLASAEGLVIAAGEWGKYKTAFQMLGVMCLVVHYTYPMNFFWFWTFPAVNFNAVGTTVIWISIFFSVGSAVSYFRLFFHALDEKRRGAPA